MFLTSPKTQMEVFDMKKFLSLVLSVLMLVTCMCTTAFAAEAVPGVIVENEAEIIVPTDKLTVDNGMHTGNPMSRASSSNYDLGEDGSLSMTINSFLSGSTRQSDYNYKTNSTKIKITMKSDISISVRVTLYDAATNKSIQQTTVTVGTLFNKSVTFTNLTSASKYYIKYENLGQQDVNISGTISAK